MSNIRAAYAEVVADALLDDQSDSITREVTLVQNQDGWQSTNVSIADSGNTGGTLDPANITGAPKAKGKATVAWVPTAGDVEGHVTLTYSS